MSWGLTQNLVLCFVSRHAKANIFFFFVIIQEWNNTRTGILKSTRELIIFTRVQNQCDQPEKNKKQKQKQKNNNNKKTTTTTTTTRNDKFYYFLRRPRVYMKMWLMYISKSSSSRVDSTDFPDSLSLHPSQSSIVASRFSKLHSVSVQTLCK